mmetsp:Transcript_24700/g.29842  ORF Transcript_24700/g.29842 Transcript_24700/m.29842 type:complete len:116 (-) Transcript_24700:556-903(-)
MIPRSYNHKKVQVVTNGYLIAIGEFVAQAPEAGPIMSRGSRPTMYQSASAARPSPSLPPPPLIITGISKHSLTHTRYFVACNAKVRKTLSPYADFTMTNGIARGCNVIRLACHKH